VYSRAGLALLWKGLPSSRASLYSIQFSVYNLVKEGKLSMYVSPVITHKSPRLRELGLLDEGARQILRGVYPECNECAQGKLREGSGADL